MTLRYNNQERIETDVGSIANLVRKGWTVVENQPSPLPETNKEAQDLINFHEEIKKGFLVLPENFTLALDVNDRSVFSQMLILIKEALDLNLMGNDTPQIISDKDGQKHEISTLRFRQIMVSYGLYYKAIWDSQT